jgi:hypothetical protein
MNLDENHLTQGAEHAALVAEMVRRYGRALCVGDRHEAAGIWAQLEPALDDMRRIAERLGVKSASRPH